ncbi:hypothetical protein OO184_22215 [Photorhabdus sp. APURE]|uniref:hypothetical protein n=1 Tax=Photorhabdus aballayi TaxID=2991723 RepID=UPI00223D0A78|nr:hypothetical protein [Photorhabdus aballayi]MCW7550570.1 hypothetical protein [Photorhabdus aballayi]
MGWNNAIIVILWHWLVSGMIIVCIGMTCYVFCSGYIRSQQWRIIFGMVGLIWLAAFGLRLNLFGCRLGISRFWRQERQYINEEWQGWANRYMAVLHNDVFLPEKGIATIVMQGEDIIDGVMHK